MANIAVKFKGLTGQLYDLTIDNGQTFTQLKAAIATGEGLSAAFYSNIALEADISKNLADTAATTLLAAGAIVGSKFITSCANNGTKQVKQERKLAIAEEKRQADGDTNANFYRTKKTLDLDRLSAKYVTNTPTNQVLSATALTTDGIQYYIVATGNTDFTTFGAADSLPGTVFTMANQPGTGTGTASPSLVESRPWT